MFNFDTWRTINVVLMGIGLIITLMWWARYNDRLSAVRFLRMGALSMALFTGCYGSYEIVYLDTLFRVPMVTITAVWAIIAGVIPEDYEHHSKKGRHGKQ